MLDDVAPRAFPTERDTTPRITDQHIWVGERLENLTAINLSSYLCRGTLYVSEDENEVADLFIKYGGTRLLCKTATYTKLEQPYNGLPTTVNEFNFISFQPHGTLNAHVLDNDSNRPSCNLATATIARAKRKCRDEPDYHLVIDRFGSYVVTAIRKPQIGLTAKYRHLFNF